MAVLSILSNGFTGLVVSVECNISRGLPVTSIVGLASKSVDESKERVRIAINALGYTYPKGKILINLAPADLPKDSSSLDMAMAVSILEADGQISNIPNKNYIFIGELGLDGSIRPVRGLIGKTMAAKNHYDNPVIFVPKDNQAQVSMIPGATIYPVATLKDLIEHLNGNKPIKSLTYSPPNAKELKDFIDFSEIIGQDAAKRALLIAASGGHNILLSGPPGTGKSMLCKAFIGLLPDLDEKATLEVTHIHSLSSTSFEGVISRPPLRSPHHTASDVALIGGGHNLKPGEISLAHNGVLFLDELPEYKRSAIEALRQPLEDGQVTISRAQQSTTYPSTFTLIATSNPCPCGYLNSEVSCTCTPNEIHRYQKKLSGPLIDRIDIHITVRQLDHKNLLKNATTSESTRLRDEVKKAHTIQKKRNSKLNSHLTNKELKSKLKLQPQAADLLNSAAKNMKLSARSYIKTLKVAQTIADLQNSSTVNTEHVAEALQYRSKINIL